MKHTRNDTRKGVNKRIGLVLVNVLLLVMCLYLDRTKKRAEYRDC